MNPLASTLIDGLRVTLLRRPRGHALTAGAGVFVALTAIYLAVMLGMEVLETPWPWRLSPAGFQRALTDVTLTFVAAWFAATIAQRPSIALNLANLLLAARILNELFIHWPTYHLTRAFVSLRFLDPEAPDAAAAAHLLAFATSGAVAQFALFAATVGIGAWLTPAKYRKKFVPLAILAVFVLAHRYFPQSPMLSDYPFVSTSGFAITDERQADHVASESIEDSVSEQYLPPDFDPEAIMYEQSALLDAELAKLAPQRPGTVDLYVIAFAGDAVENVFRNEVEHVERLFAQRFDADGRVVVLANNAQAPSAHPLASWTSLHRAVGAIANTMDPAEDILLVYLTTHGSEEHELLVDLEPLPLNQIAPLDLADALNTAPGIRWKVVVVNACYSGGFIDALRDDSTLVIASARADRTSFGCGTESDITYFGKAFLAEALNQTTSLRVAFDLAVKSVAAWEAADQQEHSEPQIASSPSIEAKLAKWREQLPQRPAVPFVPATPPS